MSKEQNKIYVKAQKGVNMEDLKLLKSGIEITRKSTAMNAFLNATRQISNTWNGNENTPKLNKVLLYLSKHPKPAIVYSNWIGNGIKPLASMLEKKNMSYLEFTGGMTDVKKNKVVTDYNNGKIDVLLLSSSGGEGLDLKNTRQIHIMEPHWNEAKISQVIGRGIRYKSHEALPLAQRHVSVFHWISTPLAAKEVGTDEYLYQISNQKLEEMKQFLETSIKYSVENTREQKKSKKSNQLVKMRRSLKNNRSNSPSLNMYQYLSPE
jgi:ERCC4-related helicase